MGLSPEVKQWLADLAAVPNYQELSRDQRLLTRDDRWKSFLLHVMPRRVEANAVRILGDVPGGQLEALSKELAQFASAAARILSRPAHRD